MTTITFKSSIWISYYKEHSIKELAEALTEKLYDSTSIATASHRIMITPYLTPDDIKKLIEFFEEHNAWQTIDGMYINVEEE